MEDADIKIEHEADVLEESNLLDVWQKYQEFEVCCLEASSASSESLAKFVSEWQERMCTALAVGCQYSDTVLAFKLLEKVNLDFPSIKSILSSLEYPAQATSLLNQTVQQIKLLYEQVSTDLNLLEQEETDTRIKRTRKGRIKKSIRGPSSNKDQVTDIVSISSSDKVDPERPFGVLAELIVDPSGNQERDKVNFKGEHDHSSDLSDYFDDVDGGEDDNQDVDQHPRQAGDENESTVAVDMKKNQCPRCHDIMKPTSKSVNGRIERFTCTACNVQIYVNADKVKRKKGKEKFDSVAVKAGVAENVTVPRLHPACDTCGRKFRKTCELRSHSRTHLRDRLFVCPLCSAECPTRREYAQHRLQHPNSVVFTCVDCEQEFVDLVAYRQHRTAQHDAKDVHPEGDYSCQECGVRHTCLVEFQAHRDLHQTDDGATAAEHNGGSNGFQCDICGKEYKTKSSLRYHNRVHTDERPYLCTVCQKAFHTSSNLRGHMRTHTGEKPHECQMCGRLFALKHTLMDHMRTHTGEKPFTCDNCGRSFAHAITLRNHKKSHTGEKPHKCPVCPMAFKIGDSLKRHLRVHTGEKPFVCPVCRMAFPIKDKMKKHMRRHIDKAEDANPS